LLALDKKIKKVADCFQLNSVFATSISETMEEGLVQKLGINIQDLNIEQKSEFTACDNYFKKNTDTYIGNLFKLSHEKKIEIARQLILICCNTICNLNCNVHIINDSFRKCILNYQKWRSKTAADDISLCLKMDTNIRILKRQIEQMSKFVTCDDEDKWQQYIEEELAATGYTKGFIEFFFGMFSMRKDIYIYIYIYIYNFLM